MNVGWLVSHVVLCLIAGVLCGATYHVGYLSGKGDLAEWMRETNIQRFKVVERCPNPTMHLQKFVDPNLKVDYR